MATHANGGTREDDQAFAADKQPRQILSLAEHIENVPDMSPLTTKRKKKAKKLEKIQKMRRKDRELTSSDDEQTQAPSKKARKTKRQVHEISDSDYSGELQGFQPGNLLPVFSRRDRPSSSPRATHSKALPAWMSAPTPPGPWDRESRNAESSDSDDDDVALMDIRAPSPHFNEADAQGLRKKANISLDQYMQVINTDEEVAPNVWPDVASLVEATWGKQHKDEIKQLYDSHKRPGNTPSLQKVVLDPELDSVLGDRFPRSKRTDATLQAIGNAISKAAVCLTEILHTNMSDMTPEATTKATLAKSFDAMRV